MSNKKKITRVFYWRENEQEKYKPVGSLVDVKKKLNCDGGEGKMILLDDDGTILEEKNISPKLPVRIRITKSTRETFWYANLIDLELDVFQDVEYVTSRGLVSQFEVFVPDSPGNRFVDLDDCEILNL